MREYAHDGGSVMREVKEYRHLDIGEGDVVLDLGGHIGLFAVHAYERGAARVVSVEPEADNCRAHRVNTSDYPQHVLLQAACVGDRRLTALLFVNRGPNKARHSLKRFDDSEPVRVAAVNFTDVLRFAKPTVLKVDVEGAEYGYKFQYLPRSVKALAVELHDLPNDEADEERTVFARMGFKEVYHTQEARSYKLFVYRR